MAIEKILETDTLNQGRVKINNILDDVAENYSELKEDLDNFFIENKMRNYTMKNGTYDKSSGLFTPTGRKYFCGAYGFENNRKYRIVFCTTKDTIGKVSLYVMNNGSWALSDVGGKVDPKANEIVYYDLTWTYGTDSNTWLVVNYTNGAWDASFYLCVYDITDLSEKKINLINAIYPIGLSTTDYSYENKHSEYSDIATVSETTNNILNTSMPPKQLDKNKFDAGGLFATFPITVDSTQSSQPYLFKYNYITDEKSKITTGKYILSLIRISIDSLDIKEGKSSLEGLKYKFVNKLNHYHDLAGSFFNIGDYVIHNCFKISENDNVPNEPFIGISMDSNYNDYNSIVTIKDVSYIILTEEEKEKYSESIINAYTNGYDFPMLSLTSLENFEKTAEDKSSWFLAKKYCAYGDSITAQDYYPTVLKNVLGFSNGYNNGVGGRAIYTMATDDAIATIPSDSDVIIVMGGTNDWAQHIQLGTIDDTTTSTFYGSLNVMAKKLSIAFPNKIIVFATTPYGLLPNQSNWTDQTGYKNNIGLTTGDYGKCIIDVARKYGFPCADVYGKCGWNKHNITEWVNFDGGYLHTKPKGGYRIGEIICGVLKAVEPSGLY